MSLPNDDVATLDAFVRSAGLPSRSAALQHAVRMLHLLHLEDDYATAWEEWDASGERAAGHTARIFPFLALLPASRTGLRRDSKAHAEQVRSVAVERLGPVLGRVPAEIMAELDEALRLHLRP